MSNNDSMKSLLIELFQRLNNSDVPYAVLRGYEELPDQVSHDIDFCVGPGNLEDALDIVAKVMNANGYREVQFSSRQGFSQVYYYGKEGCLKLDFWTAFKFRGLVYLEIDELLHSTKNHNNIIVLNESAELTVSFLKEFLHNGIMREDKISSLSFKAKNYGFMLKGACKSDIFEAERYREKLLSQDLNFSSLSKNFIRGLLYYNLSKVGVVKTVCSIADYMVRFALDKLSRRSVFVVFLGPDGSGKTTIAQLLLDDVREKKSSFTDAKYIHGRWGFLPNLGRLKGEVKQVVGSLEFDTVEHIKPMAHTKIRISAYMGYYFIDYLIGSLKLILFRGQNRLTVADRYFYDYFIAEHFEDYPKIFKFIYTKLLRSPDLIVYLEADADIIRKRKPELTVQKIQKQQKRINDLFKEIPNIVRLSTNTKGESIEELKILINTKRISRKS